MQRQVRPLLICCALLIALASPARGCDEDSGFYFDKTSEAFEVAVIVSAQGRPLAGAEVRCAFAGIYASTRYGPSAVTDRDGKVRIRSASQHFKLVATHPDYRRAVSDWFTPEDVANGPVTLDLARGVRLRGRVFDATGAPVTDAWLRLHDPTLDDLHLHSWQENHVLMPDAVRTDASGAFAFAEPVLGELTLEARGPDGATSERVLDLAVGRETDAGGRREITVQLEDGRTVSGRVELDGRPIENVHVSWQCSDRRYPEGKKLSGPGGAFTLKQLEGNDDCAVVATPSRDLSEYDNRGAIDGFIATHVPAQVGERDILLSLRSEAPGSLTIRFDGAYERYGGKFELAPLGAIRGTTPTRVLDEYGSETEFVLAALRPGEYVLRTDLDNGMDPEPVEIHIESGHETRVTLEVPDGMARGTASGRAVDAETGRPLSDVRMTQSQRHVVTMDAHLDADGRFEFDYVAEQIGIWLKRDGYQKVSLEIDVGAGESAELGDIPMSPL